MNLSAVADAEEKFLESGVIEMLFGFLNNNKSGSAIMVYAVSIVMNTCAGEDPVKQKLLDKGVIDSLAPLIKPATPADPETWPALCLQVRNLRGIRVWSAMPNTEAAHVAASPPRP